MRILCCFTGIHPATAESLRLHAPCAEVIDLTSDPVYGYWREITARWTGKQDLVIIEQDIEIHDDVIPSFAACPEPWCTFSYPIFRTNVDLTIGLGCTKISASAQRMVTAAELAEGFALCPACEGRGCWWHLDARIAETLKYKCGLKQHVHGSVVHHHDYSDNEPGEAVECHGRPIEWFFEDEDTAPAVELGRDWPLRDLIAVTPRQALLIAGSLADLAERDAPAVPARQSTAMRHYWEGNDAASAAALGPRWRPGDKYAADGQQALGMAADLALLAAEHNIDI